MDNHWVVFHPFVIYMCIGNPRWPPKKRNI